jgi:hypothetical protein
VILRRGRREYLHQWLSLRRASHSLVAPGNSQSSIVLNDPFAEDLGQNHCPI